VNGLANVLVVGGAAADRLEIAQEFHREGVWSSGRLVAIDVCSEAAVLHGALQAWLSGVLLDATHDLLRVAERGTLFLDRITCLPTSTQRMLLVLLRGLEGEEGRERKWLGRIVTGSPEPLAEAVGLGRFSRALEDALDKIRVHLPGPSRD
jgi:DNA-binding NtrC family response regulator